MRAGDGIRTHDNNVGNVVLYQLSYTRTDQAEPVEGPGGPTALAYPPRLSATAAPSVENTGTQEL